jgi:flavodoxin
MYHCPAKGELRMNTLIIYDTEFGNTASIAQRIAQTLESYGTVQLLPAHTLSKLEVQNIDLLLIGSPTQYHGMSPTMLTLLEELPDNSLQNIAAAVFDTRYQDYTGKTGSAAAKIAQLLQQAGAHLLVPAKSFFVVDKEGPLAEDELADATQWTLTIIERLKLFAH